MCKWKGSSDRLPSETTRRPTLDTMALPYKVVICVVVLLTASVSAHPPATVPRCPDGGEPASQLCEGKDASCPDGFKCTANRTCCSDTLCPGGHKPCQSCRADDDPCYSPSTFCYTPPNGTREDGLCCPRLPSLEPKTEFMRCPNGALVTEFCTRAICPDELHCTVDGYCCEQPERCPGGEAASETCRVPYTGLEPKCRNPTHSCYTPFLNHKDGLCCPDVYKSVILKCPNGVIGKTLCQRYGELCPNPSNVCYIASSNDRVGVCCPDNRPLTIQTCPDGTEVDHLCLVEDCPVGLVCTEEGFCCKPVCPDGHYFGETCQIGGQKCPHHDELCFQPSPKSTEGYCCEAPTCPGGDKATHICTTRPCPEGFYCTQDKTCCRHWCPGGGDVGEVCEVGGANCGKAGNICYVEAVAKERNKGVCCSACPTVSDDKTCGFKHDQCNHTTDCRHGGVCCPGRCGRACHAPLFQPAWKCPATCSLSCKGEDRLSRCEESSDCPGLTKCCYDGCKRSCIAVFEIMT